MKGILGLLRYSKDKELQDEAPDSVLFSEAFKGHGVDADALVPWEARAVEVGAVPMKPKYGIERMEDLWLKKKFMPHIAKEDIKQLGKYMLFATVPADRDLIRQEEYGNFMVLLLRGTIAIERVQPWGARLHLAESGAGEILGEMSLLDSGIRFSLCTTTSDCEIAILSAGAMDDMLVHEPRLAATFVALLARKLSLRLRIVSARLSEK